MKLSYNLFDDIKPNSVETELFYCNSRYYNPEWGRFISPDSIDYLNSESINGLNLYAYCGNDLFNYYDPSGYFVMELIAGLILLDYI